MTVIRQAGTRPRELNKLDLPAILTADSRWLITEEGFNLAREHEVESLLTVGNGYVGTRGALAERCSLSSPATYLAGAFETRSGNEGGVPDLMSLPDWTSLAVTVEGQKLGLEDQETLDHRRILDLRQGVLWRQWRHRDAAGRITGVRRLRLASLADRHVLLQSTLFTAENYSGRVMLENTWSPVAVQEANDALPPADVSTAWARQVAIDSASRCLVVERQAEGDSTAAAFAVGSQLRGPKGVLPQPELHADEAGVRQRWIVEVEIGQAYRLDQLVSVYSSRDSPRPAEAAINYLNQLRTGPVQDVVNPHLRAWTERWQSADVQVDGAPEAARALRFAGYHLIGAANPDDEQVSVGARGLTGEAYMGHVFWDTELFMLPFYIYTQPATARALLMYRYHTLTAARDKARSLGYQGALYAWESAGTGEESTPPIALAPDGTVSPVLTGVQENHISAAVAYAVWHYWQASGDEEFFLKAGAEILLETARFWASRGNFGEDGCYHISSVIGPDEYHESVDDNVYTNVMAQWNLQRAAEAIRTLKERWPRRWQDLARQLELSAEEPEGWENIAEKMSIGLDPQTELLEQFRGYFELEEIDLESFEPRTASMDVLLGRERIERSKILKQADVVMLLHLLRGRFFPSVQAANFRYYEPRTAHDSSLSPAIHAAVAARLDAPVVAEAYFRQTEEIDLGDREGNAARGIHMAALGGLWQAAVFGFAGMSLRSDGLAFSPQLPAQWHRLTVPLRWRGRGVSVVLNREPRTIEVRVMGEAPMVVAVAGGPAVTVQSGQRWKSRWQNGGWLPWEERQT